MIKITDVQHVRYRVPDLAAAETFLTDLGLVTSARTDQALYMRGTDPDHHCYVAETGQPAFVGAAFEVDSAGDLETVAAAAGASDVEEIDEPGGGHRVRLTDPSGYQIDIVHGIEKLDPLPLRNQVARNSGSNRGRLGERAAFEPGPCQVKRLGHYVLFVEDFAASDGFYRSLLGLLSSDDMLDADGKTVVSRFYRCDRGPVHVDHHTLYLKDMTETRCHHIGLELEDLEAVQFANKYMAARDYKHNWGVGRHIVGSNIFDQWFDPWGNLNEYFADMDLLDATEPAGAGPVTESLNTHWGPPHPYG